MKGIVFFVFTFISLCLSAQQALWSGSQIVSPQINKDNTVTFRIFAPEATKVEVTGDFLPTQKLQTPFGEVDAPGTAALTKNPDGVWEITSAALAPELYSYNFIVDGLKINDPSNVYQLRDIQSITNVFLIDDNAPADLYAVRDVPHGSVSKVWYPTGDTRRRMTVYTPAGYETGTERYPVFYLLHGMGGDENAWTELGRAAQILDNQIAKGITKPMIVVMTNGNMDMQAAPGDNPDGMRQPTTQLPHTMDGTFEQAFPDVVKFVDDNYRTLADKKHRAIAGLSMGGFHSLHISGENPDMFDYVGLFSAAILPNQAAKSPVYQNFEGKLKTQFSKNPALYYIAIGDRDFLYQANKEYRKLLDDNGFKYTYLETDGGHIWRNWRKYLADFAPRLFRQ